MTRHIVLPGILALVAAGVLSLRGAVADVPSALMAQGGGAPPGYYEPTFFDPDYQGDQGLVSYNDPFAGQSDQALQAKIGPLRSQDVFSNPSGYNPNLRTGGAAQQSLRQIYVLSKFDAREDGGFSPRGIKSTEWSAVIGGRDTTTADDFREITIERRIIEGITPRGSGASPLDILAVLESAPPGRDLMRIDPNLDEVGTVQLRPNQTSEELIGADFYWALERDGTRDYNAFLDKARAERSQAQSQIDGNLRGVLDSLQSVQGGGSPEYDQQSYAAVRRGLQAYRDSVQAELELLSPYQRRARQTIGEITSILEADPTRTGTPVRTSDREDTYARNNQFLADRVRERGQVLENVVRGTIQEVRQIDQLLNQLDQMEQVNRSLFHRKASPVKCGSPCTLSSLGLPLGAYVANSAFYFAGRSPQSAPIYNTFGPVSQFDRRWINERSQGPDSPFDRRWINERSQGPISEFDQTWINERSIGPEDMQSWSQKFPSTSGLPGANPQDAFSGLTASIVEDLRGLDARLLVDGTSRAAVAEMLAGQLVREFRIDPAVGKAVADGTLIAITQALLGGGGLTGGGSTGGFSDVSIELPLLFEAFDFATVDGDIITLRVSDRNGVQLGPVDITLTGPNTAEIFAPSVSPGPIEIAVTAVNEGAFSPNTGEVRILSNITQGQTTQRFNLLTGETGILSITAAPPPPIR